MCRILAMAAARPFPVRPWLESFAESCRASHEYQGDGWGIAWWNGTDWERRRTLDPIWSASVEDPPPSSAYLVHARSAFAGSALALELNMPFLGGGCAFAFNGELRGVRLSVPGANGAQRLFTLFTRFRDGPAGSPSALARLDAVMSKRAEYVRALNVVVADEYGIHVASRFNQDPAYFTMHTSERARGPEGEVVSVACSEALRVPGADVAWRAMASGARQTLVAPPADFRSTAVPRMEVPTPRTATSVGGPATYPGSPRIDRHADGSARQESSCSS